MELFPTLEIGWLNGWILICLLYLTYGIVLLVFPKDAVVRLYDKSGRNKRQKILIYIGSLFAFGYFVLIIFTPLKNQLMFSSLELFYLSLVWWDSLSLFSISKMHPLISW